MPRDSKPGGKAASTVINQVINVDGVLRKARPRDRGPESGGGNQGLDDKLDDIVRRRNHEELRQDLKNKIDEVSAEGPGQWSGKRRKPCMSAVQDNKSGETFYNHNIKTGVKREELDPLLRERFDKWQNGDPSWRKDLEPNQSNHGTPGEHSEVRALNEALKKAREDGREPRLEDFMVENAKVTKEGNPGHKAPMPCCGNCAQMLDGVDGAWGGWDKPFGTKQAMWDGK